MPNGYNCGTISYYSGILYDSKLVIHHLFQGIIVHKKIKNSVVGKVFSGKYNDELRFFKNWVGSPKTTGSIMPTGTHLARSMASAIRLDGKLPVLELGPGTGSITSAILEHGVKPENLYALEYSENFLESLRSSFPDINLIHGDAFELDRSLADFYTGKFEAVVSALPLLNFPQDMRIGLIETLLDRLEPGRPVIQFSYGPMSPVLANRGTYTVEHHDWIMRNVPPARVWLYRRPVKS
jgi:phosphatidylethanolamine/phosphatidyl-N-methylethanolamine N-methyltransferase